LPKKVFTQKKLCSRLLSTLNFTGKNSKIAFSVTLLGDKITYTVYRWLVGKLTRDQLPTSAN